MSRTTRSRTSADAAVTDVVGTVILLGVTVTLVAGLALHLVPVESGTVLPVRLEVTATGNATSIAILHRGGDTLDRGDLRAVVVAAGAVRHESLVGASGALWQIGEEVVVPLPAPLPPGPAEVTIVHEPRSAVVATAGLRVEPTVSTTPPAGFTVSVKLDGQSTPLAIVAPAQVLAEATVTHPDGRKLVRHVSANLSSVDGPRWVALRDDGTRGDRMAGDGVWTGVLYVPLSSPRGSVAVPFTAVDLAGTRVEATGTLVVA